MDLHDHRNHNSPSHKSCSSIIGSLFYSAELKIVFFLVMWDEQSALLSDTNQHKDFIQESLVAENYIATHYCFQNQILFTKIQ